MCNSSQPEGHQPNVQLPIPTWELLLYLGFVSDQSLISGIPGGLIFDFGNFRLAANQLINMRCQSVVLLDVVMTSSRSITEVACEMPLEVESWEQGVAWVTWCLDNHSGGEFRPAHPVAWLNTGRQNRHLLPWEQQMAAYKSRPHCIVQRDWARVALRNLAEQLTTADDSAEITIQFDGEILTIRHTGKLIAMSALGNPWAHQYAIHAGALRRLPKRLMREMVGISIWETALIIDSYSFSGVVEIDVENGHKSPVETL